MLGATMGKERPWYWCGEGTSYLLLQCLRGVMSILWSRQKSLRRVFCIMRSYVWHVMDLLIGLSCRVYSLSRRRLDIHTSSFVCE